jgi:hypothetical protein
MNDPVFWQIGFVVVQEALIATVATMAVIYLVRGLLNGLNQASAKVKPATALEPSLPAPTGPSAS